MIASHNNIPIYEAIIDSEDAGMVVVSLVGEGAIESDFMAFDKMKEPLRFSVENEEQRMVLGAVMIPEKLIYRETLDGFPYYVKYSSATIHKMAEKYFAELNQNNVDTDHSFNLVDGVTLVQAFFKNTAKGINPVGFEDLPDDTLFFQYHVLNNEVWDGIKAGTWNGFSLAGTFDIVPVEMANQEPSELDQIEDLLNKIENKLNKKSNS